MKGKLEGFTVVMLRQSVPRASAQFHVHEVEELAEPSAPPRSLVYGCTRLWDASASRPFHDDRVCLRRRVRQEAMV